MDKEDPRETATEVWMDGGMGTEGWGRRGGDDADKRAVGIDR